MHYPSATELPLSGDADPIVRLERELAEARAYQAAINEVLAVIARSPGQLQPVLEAINEIAERLCGADRAQILIERDGKFHLAAHRNTSQAFLDYIAEHPFEPGMANTTGRAVLQHRTIHAADVLADPTYDRSRPMGSPGGARLSVPLLRDGRAIGVITVGRAEARGFSDRQIDLVTTFASQAVIAIENARLFEAEQTRSKELGESLEYQTAISEVLGVISRSKFDLQPVLDMIVNTAARLCRVDRASIRRGDGDHFRHMAGIGYSAEQKAFLEQNQMALDRHTLVGRVALDHKTVHVPDALADRELRADFLTVLEHRSALAVPLLRADELVGVIVLLRNKHDPFNAREIALVEAFADQAVIAIENARLLDELQTRQKELTEALEYQTATSEVLGVISRSPNELQPVLDAIVVTARRLCGSEYSGIFMKGEDGAFHIAGADAASLDLQDYLRSHPLPMGRGSGVGRAALERKTVQIADALADPEFTNINAQNVGNFRTLLSVPLLRDGEVVAVISLVHTKVQPFTRRQIDLITTFADQAVIAMNNARLFEEVQARTKELQESLKYQTATSEVLGVISKSPTELTLVLETIVETAARLCGANQAVIRRRRHEKYHVVASYGLTDELRDYVIKNPVGAEPGSVVGRVAQVRKTVHISDISDDPGYALHDLARMTGYRTMLGVPLLRDGDLLGVLAFSPAERRPFTTEQIERAETFADQAVIAISNAELFEQVQARTKELTEALDQQTATTDVLKIISKSPSDLQPVLNAIVATAARLCEAQWAIVWTPQDGKLALAAHSAAPKELVAYVKAHPIDFDRGSVVWRAALDGMPVHIADVLADPLFTQNSSQSISGMRTCLGVPLRQDGRLLGVMSLARNHVRPFSQPQIDLVATFAEQAVIAMNNARLFEEVQARQKELTESLEYQTATSEVLGVISRSPAALDLVFQAILAKAVEICESHCGAMFALDGKVWRGHSFEGGEPAFTAYLREPRIWGPHTGMSRVLETLQPVHVVDAEADRAFSEHDDGRIAAIHLGNVRTFVIVPLLRDGRLIGAMSLYRQTVRAFTDRQIELVSTFARQAVIAIENARLLDELQTRQKELARSVEELRSLGEVGRTVSASLDMRQVLQTVLENACRMASAGGGTVYVFDVATGEFHLEAGYNMSDEHIARVRAHPIRLGDRVVGECGERREAVQIEDLARVESADVPLLDILARAGVRAILAVPLLHQGEVVGALVIRRSYPGAFAPETVRLLEAFAAQSAIAVNNARLFKEVAEKGEQLRLASQHKSQFLANMSHELRTPLNAILGYTELMQDGIYGALPEKAGGVLGRVQSNGQHLLGLINSVLDLSKIEAGQLQLDLVAYGMPAVVEAVMVATESLAIEKKLKLQANVPENLPRGLGDERRLTQVLLNLVGNAIKFTEQGGVTIDVDLEGDRFLVSVADTGPGIPTAELERVFEEFHQVDSSNTKAKGGTGLGLAIAKRIVEMHGGRIWVESTLGHGATFRFEIPVSTKQSEGDDEQAHTRH